MGTMAEGLWRQAEPLFEIPPLRQFSLALIDAFIRVHDPYRPKLAVLSPPHPAEQGEFKRLDQVLPITQAHANGAFTLTRIVHSPATEPVTPFRYQTYDEPRLHALRSKYHLDDVVGRPANARNEFEAMVLLRNWTRSQFRRKDYQPIAQNFDALEVLDRNLRNDTDEPYRAGWHIDPCHFFPLLYSQIMLSMGHQARLVSIGHGMAEVWSNQFRKWITMDAELNLHYEKDGVPLNMLEVFEENYAPKPRRLQIVRGEQWSGDPSTTLVHLGVKDPVPENLIAYHHTHLDLVDLRNDWMTNRYFAGHPARSERNSLIYSDPRLRKPLRRNQVARPCTNRKRDLYWPLNQVELLAHPPLGNPLRLFFKTLTPNFDRFEVALDKKCFVDCKEATFDWSLDPGANLLSVTPINRFGVRGIPSEVSLVWSSSSSKGDSSRA